MENIIIDGIELDVERKRIKNIYISINSITGRVRISIPLKTPISTAEKFVLTKLAWIKKHKSKITPNSLPAKKNYTDGEKISLFSKEYELHVRQISAKPKAFLTFDYIDMYVNPKTDLKARIKLIDELYKVKLEEIVPTFVKKWLDVLGIKVEFNPVKFYFKSLISFDNDIEKADVFIKKPLVLTFKKMKGRWGSCNITEKKITINTELAKKSQRCVEYVTVHELLHLKEIHHNRRFKDYMKKAFPDWKLLEQELKTIN